MNLYEQINQILNNDVKPIIEFTEHIEELTYPVNKGMKAEIESISNFDGETFQITVNMSKFFEDNKLLMSHDWYNSKNKKYDLTVIESGNYPKNHIFTFYDDIYDNWEHNFKLVKISEFYDEYLKTKQDNQTYIEWLEAQLKTFKNLY